ncbi:MAG: hypothetical protein K0U24_06375 [Gammaproteobacteria bacterium]|nr:hypothetical protein [Gammaproteobacteria bacterium]MCH9763830.1 hypothetical protein [Gammaproteobacteria bacterium]
MSKILSLSKLMVGVASLTLSAGVWAGSSMNRVTDSVNDFFGGVTDTVTTSVSGWDTPNWKVNRMYEPDYMVVDQVDHRVEYLDGVDKGQVVSDEGNLIHRDDCMKGDIITNLHTNKSGIITGVKRQGTMDVMKASGENVRYQYVVFKVKPAQK